MRNLFESFRLVAALFLSATLAALTPAAAADKLGPQMHARASSGIGWSTVIIRAAEGAALPDILPAIQQIGGTPGRALPIINAQTALVPNAMLSILAENPYIGRISLDRPVAGTLERTGATVGATAVRAALGYDGAGVTVAVIDSGVTGWHDDLADGTGGARVDRFVDFVSDGTVPYDDYGHGTHVAGIIAGNGFDSGGARAGIAPGARLVVLKALDASGAGRVSTVIAALDYVFAHKDALAIRVVNLSVGAGVYESYDTDPLTVAVKQVTDAGITVVASAGNAGRDPQGRTMFGGITAPANAPWVLTVGASNHMGTLSRGDDTVAAFSSRGPTAVDFSAKPDLVAPGIGIESLSAPQSTLYARDGNFLLAGTIAVGSLPYLSLSGTSMAAPVVSGIVALMLQANPALTPNAVKAILQYTAEVRGGYDALTQGAGFVNAAGAVQLARYFASPTTAYPDADTWGHRLLWGNRAIKGGRLMPGASAWSLSMVWGSAIAPDSAPLSWGALCGPAGCDGGGSWQIACGSSACTTTAWDLLGATNIVWGSSCGGDNCAQTWTIAAAGATVDGSSDTDTVVWGSDDNDTVVWGSDDNDTVVWGSNCSDPACAPVIWNRP